MKKVIFLFFSFYVTLTFSQTNTFPPDGNVGIGTLYPSSYGHGGTNKIIEINNPNNSQNSQSHLMLTSNTLSANSSIGSVSWYVPSTPWSSVAWIGGLTEQDNQHIGVNIGTNATPRMYINFSGNVGIGTMDPDPYKLAVEGTIGARKIKVTQVNPWADYVFSDKYKLLPLSQVEQFIKTNKHLPDIPSAKEVEKNGIDVGDNQALLLKKIEEMTLYIIEIEKKNYLLEKRIEKLEIKK